MRTIENKIQDYTIDILLSTYNGESYLKEQIDSLLAQTVTDWRLIARDDGSSDGSVEILKRYAARHPGRIAFLDDAGQRFGACQSFARLLEQSEARYIMFCDQDDVWLPEKIEETRKALVALEEKYPNAPILVHTDMLVVDSGLKELSKSFWRFQHISPDLKTINRLLIMNNVTGCTIMMNRALKGLVLPVPPEAILYDWWIALVASTFGHTGYVSTPAILYRQHGRNVIGAFKHSLWSAIMRFQFSKSIETVKRIVGQGRAFFEKYGDRLGREDYEVVKAFSTLFECGRAARLFRLLKYRIKGCGLLRHIWMLFYLVCIGRHKAFKTR